MPHRNFLITTSALSAAPNNTIKPRRVFPPFATINISYISFTLIAVPFSSVSGLPKGIIKSDYELIAEPGRFFAEKVSTLFTPVIGLKGSGITISESLYGAFNCILFDHASPKLKTCIRPDGAPVAGDLVPMTIFGSTCDGGDVIYKEALVPAGIQEDDWLVWEDMGAYTSAATTRFNGFPFNDRKKIYIE